MRQRHDQASVAIASSRHRWSHRPGWALLLMGVVMFCGGCASNTRIEKGSLVAYGRALNEKPGIFVYYLGINLAAKTKVRPPSFFVVLPCGAVVRYDEIDLATAQQCLSVRTDVPEWLKRRAPADSLGFKGGGYYVGFVGKTQVGFGMFWKPEMGEVPKAGVSRQGPFWPMPLTMDQLRALVGEPDKTEKVIEITD